MKVTKYNTELSEGRAVLVKEDSGYYPNLSKRLDNPQKIADFVGTVFHAGVKTEEYTWLIANNAKLDMIGVFELSHGTFDCSMANAREIFTKLCLLGASSFSLVHNHPSGDTTPSKDDLATTERILEAGKIMGIPLIDHVIVGGESALSYTSLREACSELWKK